MRDSEWVELTDSQRGQLVAIWLLAADHDGVIPASAKLIRKLCMMESEPDLQHFIKNGFLEHDASVSQPDAKLTPKRRQSVSPEAEAEAEAETETETELEPPFIPPTTMTSKKVSKKPEIGEVLKTYLDADRVEAVIEHRKGLRRPLTARSALLLGREFAKCADPNEAADCMVANGWQGFKAEWMVNGSRRGPPISRTQEAITNVLKEVNRRKEENDGNCGRGLLIESDEHVSVELPATSSNPRDVFDTAHFVRGWQAKTDTTDDGGPK